MFVSLPLAQGPAFPEELAGASDLLLGLGILVTLVALMGMRLGYKYSLGAVLRGAASVVGSVPIIGGILSSPFDAVDHKIMEALAAGIAGVDTLAGKWLQANEALVRYTFDAAAWFAGEVQSAFDALVNGTIPHAITHSTADIRDRLGQLVHQLQHVERSLEVRLSHQAMALEAEIERDFGKAWRGIDHLRAGTAAAIAGAIALADRDIAALRGYAHRVLGRRLTRLEELVAGGAIAAAGLYIVTRTFPWLRCSNVKNVGKALCRFPTGILDALLEVGITILTWVELCEISHIIRKVAEQTEPAIRDLVVVSGAATNCWPPVFGQMDPPINGVAPPVPTPIVKVDPQRGVPLPVPPVIAAIPPPIG